MDPEFLDRSITHNRSFSVTHVRDRHLLKVFHFHEQVEIVAILKSTGTRYVGDNISRFEPGEIVIIGSNLPHMWQNDENYFISKTKDAEAIAIHLSKEFLNSGLLELPENDEIRNLLRLSRRGLLLKKNSSISTKIQLLIGETDYNSFLSLLDILNELGNAKEKQLLSSEGFSAEITNDKESRMYAVHNFIMNNFTDSITLPQAAQVATMNVSAFSRYFKKKQGVTFTQYVNKVRLGFACKLLMEERLTIIQVCYSSGFNNISNFNRQFRTKYEMSPRAYRLEFAAR